MRNALEVADVFRHHGAAYRQAHAGHLSLGQRRVMAAIETCRSAALGGHVEHCESCGTSVLLITPVVIGTAQNVRAWRAPTGWRTGSTSCCQCGLVGIDSARLPRLQPRLCRGKNAQQIWGVAVADVIREGLTPQAAAKSAFAKIEAILAKYPILQT
jgi:hypothetical protein